MITAIGGMIVLILIVVGIVAILRFFYVKDYEQIVVEPQGEGKDHDNDSDLLGSSSSTGELSL